MMDYLLGLGQLGLGPEVVGLGGEIAKDGPLVPGEGKVADSLIHSHVSGSPRWELSKRCPTHLPLLPQVEDLHLFEEVPDPRFAAEEREHGVVRALQVVVSSEGAAWARHVCVVVPLLEWEAVRAGRWRCDPSPFLALFRPARGTRPLSSVENQNEIQAKPPAWWGGKYITHWLR